MPDVPLDGATIRRFLNEVANELSRDGRQHTLIVVGGSLLALHGLRNTTVDIDSIERLDDELRAAVATVAQRHDLPTGWLNDRSAMFRPATFEEGECELLLDHTRLRVLGPTLATIFIMKLLAARAPDFVDLLILWPHTGFASAAEAAAAYAAAYPHETFDPHLIDYVQQIVSSSTS